jgi:hypothetical protein
MQKRQAYRLEWMMRQSALQQKSTGYSIKMHFYLGNLEIIFNDHYTTINGTYVMHQDIVPLKLRFSALGDFYIIEPDVLTDIIDAIEARFEVGLSECRAAAYNQKQELIDAKASRIALINNHGEV